jgi:hypothetical protein
MNIKKIVTITILTMVITGILIYFVLLWLYPTFNVSPYTSVWLGKNEKGIRHDILALELMKDVDTILSSNGIEMILMYGSLIGFMRHNGLIPWDDDIDVVVSKSDIIKIKALEQELAAKGIGISNAGHKMCTIIKLFRLNEPLIPNKTWSWPFIDVFSYTIDNNTIILEDTYPPFVKKFKKDDFFPLRTNLFENIPMKLPNNPHAILSTLYSENWETTCVSGSYNHRKEQRFNPTKKQFMIKCEELNNKGIGAFDNVWVINLERRPERWIRTKTRLEEKGIIPNRWNATDAKSSDFLKMYEAIPIPKRSTSELACYISHRNLWKHLYKLGVSNAIIFEDDIKFANGVTKKDITEAMEGSPGFNVLFLGHCLSLVKNFEFPVTRVGAGMCLHAYVVSRAGLKKLIDIEDNFILPIDWLVHIFCKKELCYLSKSLPHTDKLGYGAGIIHQDDHEKGDLRGKRFIEFS